MAILRIVFLSVDASALDVGLVLEARPFASGHDAIRLRDGFMPVKPRFTSHQAPDLGPCQLTGMNALANAVRLIMFAPVQPGGASKYRSRDEQCAGGK